MTGPPSFPALAALAALLAFPVFSGCGPGELTAPAPDSLRTALTAPPEALDLTPPGLRALLYAEAVRQSRLQADAQLLDSPAWLAVARGARLEAAALPSSLFSLNPAGHPVRAPANDALIVDLSRSSDAWPDDLHAGLGGRSERQLAAQAGVTVAAALGLVPEDSLVIERAAGAPYAAAYIDGRLWLNPALLYLAAATEEPMPWLPQPAARETREPPQGPAALRNGCSSAPAAAAPWLAGALVALRLVRRRR